ncbi:MULTISPECIES: iron-containing alcohol dehydrogenase [unclassified Micromonospora]|uniref:iron-containing alcohol dehydrogenase n=1 Tax=unclassified Micromonospora TaxID=2617518 RepID=UPI001B3971DC|nr:MULTISPECIES: iron-containing alcohol dehydrogenase [unclassified Micromonospora]MBQ1046309.1 iron-containing alcohol dehydrogenase [Micromonospora sp. C72]MBQ1058838.1 iron-containing alcohol dehydrogenase [Micromonospora sp. C32]
MPDETAVAEPTGDDLRSAAVGTLRLPPRIHFGYGARRHLPEVVRVHGRRVLAVVDPFLVRTPIFRETVDALTEARLDVLVHSDITPELPVDTLEAAVATARDYRAEVVLAIGGGSALDAAKLIALLSAYGGPAHRYYGENLVPGPIVPLVAVPTTAGTGSEVTPVAVVSDPDRELKVGISSPFLVPSAAVVDPEFTLGTPATVTAWSGIDALVHAVESFTARPVDLDWSGLLPVFTGRNVLSEPLALQAAARLGPWLPVAVHRPGDRQARREVALGSLLGGMAFGATGTHLCHALQYPIGALTKTPHGLGTGLMLPYVIDTLMTQPAVAAQLAALGAALEAIPAADASAARTLARVVEINREIGVPRTLAEIGLTRGQLPQIAELGLRSTRLIAAAPVDPSRELLLDILERAHDGALANGSLR